MSDMNENVNIDKAMHFSFGRLLSMSLASVLLFFSFMMSIFSPYPIGLSFILYGRAKGLAVAFCASILCYWVSVYLLQDSFLFGIFFSVILSALAMGEIVLRGINPIKGMIALTGVAVTIIAILLSMLTSVKGESLRSIMLLEFEKKSETLEQIKEGIKSSGEENSLEMEALLSQPEKMVDMTLKSGPSYIIMSFLIFLWVNIFLLLKSFKLVTLDKKLNFSEDYFSHFRVNENVIWLVILSGCLTLWGSELGEWGPTIGITLLKTLGVFYFFQGFGIYLAFLDYLKLKGFFRSLMVVITIMTAGQALAVVGLFDMFVNFRKFLKRKKSGE